MSASRKQNLITKAIDIVGINELSDMLGITYQAVRKWEKSGKLPRTEWTHETNYAEIIHKATVGKVSKHELVPERYPKKNAA